ncbi:VWA domain-containing protein [Actinoplanes sp. NPDC051346]|uniref:VWA domain-containing protein n=1 Tax=Actinoplanes sp. NPDC051346 TaxID=3155048 RepID=UPI0034238672
MPGQRYTVDARGYAGAADDAARPYADKLGVRRLDDVRADSGGYLDGARYRSEADGQEAYKDRQHLVSYLHSRLQSGKKQDTAATIGQVAGLSGSLAAGRLTADAAIQDAAAALSSAQPGDPTPSAMKPAKPAGAYQLSDNTDTMAGAPAVTTAKGRAGAIEELAQARTDFARADEAMRAGEPVSAAVLDGLAWRHAFHALVHLGVTYTGDRDADGLTDLMELRIGASPLRVDTDGDGLTDKFEVETLIGWTYPAQADSDGDGVGDAAEDTDGDGSSNLAEQKRGTSPTEPDADRDASNDGAEAEAGTDPAKADTDGDTLLDGAEPRLGFDPTKADTDGDGILDAADTVAVPADGPDGVKVTLHGTGDLVSSLSITKVDARFADATMPGLVGDAYDFNLSDDARQRMAQADLTLPYDPARLGTADPADLRVFYHDPQAGMWYPATEEQSVDIATHTVRATVGHFSTYAVFDIVNWQQTWSASTNPCRSRFDGPAADVVLLDLSLILDSSGSMSSNDPAGLRRSSAKNFVDALLPEDRAAVVDFDDYAKVLQPLTTDKTAVKTAIDRVDDSGGTNIGAGVRAGTDLLINNGDPKRARIAILLTDGEGYYDSSLTARAKAHAISIYTIGLGRYVDTNLLTSIATNTGGKYYNVATAADLPQVFRRISEETGGGDPSTTTDTDGDGLFDCIELRGFRGDGGRTYVTDPTQADTDGDGLTDGDEAGEPIDFNELYTRNPTAWAKKLADGAPITYRLYSDPTTDDTDHDRLNDADELDLELSPWVKDSDGDQLIDGYEVLEANTDPENKNTDGDHWDDTYEVDHEDDEDLSPLFFDERVSKWTYARDVAAGFFLGDANRIDSIAWLIGSVCSGALSFIPVAGWVLGGIADLRDAIASAVRGDWVGAGFSAAGLIPYGGDAVAIPGKVGKFVERNLDKADEALAAVSKIDGIPRDALIKAAKQVLKQDWDDLVKHGFSEDTLLFMMDHKQDLKHFANVVRKSTKFGGSPAGVMDTGKDGERFLAGHFNATNRGVDMEVYRSTKAFTGKRGGRRWDVFKNNVAHESKVGMLHYEKRFELQIQKDLWLKRTYNVDLHWHFFVSGVSGTAGPDAKMLDLLLKNNIPFTIHVG